MPFQRLVVPVKAGQGKGRGIYMRLAKLTLCVLLTETHFPAEVTLGELLEQYKTHSGLSPG